MVKPTRGRDDTTIDGTGTGYRPSAERRVKLDGRPSLSIVMAAQQQSAELAEQLGRLSEPCAALSAELIVAGLLDETELAELQAQHPNVRFIACPPGTTRFGLREAGLASADGDIVTILEGDDVGPERLAHLAALIQDRAPGSNGEVEDVDEPPGVRTVDRLKPGDHVVVIGGGPGGLTAAYILAKKGVRVTVLEGTDTVGGISQTAQYKGYRFDIGGHRFFTKIKPVDDLWHEILGDEFISVPRLSRIHYEGKFFDYPLKAFNALGGLGIWKAITIVLSYIRAHMRPSPVEDNLEQWVTNRFGKKLYEIFFKTYTEKVWGMPCTEIRAEWAAQRIQNLSLAKAILSAAQLNRRSTAIKSLINEFKYPRYGPGQMWETCTKKIEGMGSRVLMRHHVKALETREGKVVAVRADTPNGEVRIEGQHFISTMPVRTLLNSLDPAPPPATRAAANGLLYRDFLTVALILDKDELFPDNWIYIHTPGVKVGRIQNFNNWSRAMVPDAGRTCLGLEYFCFEGDGLWTSANEDLIALGTRELEQLGLAKGAKVLDGTVVRMPKAYPVYDSAYRDHLVEARKYLDPISNLHPVGRNGMHKYNNQDHSMLTAMMTVWNMEGAEHNVWAVNTDFEYHEEQRLEAPKAEAAGAPA